MRRALGIALACAGLGCGAERPLELLLLVTVDTLRADHLGAYGSERDLTPVLTGAREQPPPAH